MITRIYTGDPVRDAEAYYSEYEEAKRNREYIECDLCHEPIFCEDEEFDGDTYYEIEGLNICECCIRDYLEDNKKKAK